MIEIIGENINEFCKGNVIVLNNFFDDHHQSNRSKRSTDKKRYQGQTQTQFVSFGSKDSNQQTNNGLAEALSQPDLSRATVSKYTPIGIIFGYACLLMPNSVGVMFERYNNHISLLLLILVLPTTSNIYLYI